MSCDRCQALTTHTQTITIGGNGKRNICDDCYHSLLLWWYLVKEDHSVTPTL